MTPGQNRALMLWFIPLLPGVSCVEESLSFAILSSDSGMQRSQVGHPFDETNHTQSHRQEHKTGRTPVQGVLAVIIEAVFLVWRENISRARSL